MKRGIWITAVLLPLAFVAGRMTGMPDDAGDRNAGETGKQASGKYAERPRATESSSIDATPDAWKVLRRRALAKPADLMNEMLVNLSATQLSGVEGGDWLEEHLLLLDPQGTLKAVRDEFGSSVYDNFKIRWCIRDPERALPLLLAEWKKSGASASSHSVFGYCPIEFSGMGRVDPEKGLQMILDLPESQRQGTFFSGLLTGIAGSEPSKAFDFFERMSAARKFSEQELSEMVPVLANADPDKVREWAKSRYDPVPPALKSQIVVGLASNDPAVATDLYRELPDDPSNRRQPAFWIANHLAREDENLDASWNWLKENAPPSHLEELKANALSAWAWTHKTEAAERILADPELITGERSGEMISLMQSLGRGAELEGMLERLEPAQAEKLRTSLIGSGIISGDPKEITSTQQWLNRMRQDPGATEEIYQSLGKDEKEQLMDGLRGGSYSFQDPSLILNLLGSSSENIRSQGWRESLAKLTLMNPAEARRVVESMPEGAERKQAAENLHGNWVIDDATAADAWLNQLAAGK